MSMNSYQEHADPRQVAAGSRGVRCWAAMAIGMAGAACSMNKTALLTVHDSSIGGDSVSLVGGWDAWASGPDAAVASRDLAPEAASAKQPDGSMADTNTHDYFLAGDAADGSDLVSLSDAAPDAHASPEAKAAIDAGTQLGAPVEGTTYKIWIPVSQIPADSFSWIPLVLTATQPDGTAALVDVVLSLDRDGGGILKPRVLSLTDTGGVSYLIPCSDTATTCTLGTIRIQMALAAAPDVIVAQSDPIELIHPTGVGSPAACMLGGNAMFFDGNDYIYQGVMTVTDAVFTDSRSNRTVVTIDVKPRTASQGNDWTLSFSSGSQASAQQLAEQAYFEAVRYPFNNAGPGISIDGNSRGCNTIAGSFEVHELEWAGNQLQRFTVIFDQHCEGGSSSLRGCLHYEVPQ
jgi:hypothetical protein